MKLTVEIKDGQWKYEYDVGESRGTSTRHIDPDSLCAFTDLLRYASKASSADREEWWNEVKAKAWMEKNQTKAQEFLNGKIK